MPTRVAITEIFLWILMLPLSAQEKKMPFKPGECDSWESWNAFEKGAMIEREIEFAGSRNRATVTLDKKEEGVIHLKTVDSVSSVSRTIDIKKSAAEPDGNCPVCGKPWKDHKDGGKWSEETLKIDGKVVTCQKYETPGEMCNGRKNKSRPTFWYSEDVPGYIVKMEGGESKITTLKFDGKKVRGTDLKKKEGDFKYDGWESWNSFKEGSMIEFEMESSGFKYEYSKTIGKKEAEVIHFKTEERRIRDGKKTVTPGTEDMKKPPAAAEGDCPMCKQPMKDHKDLGKWSEETLKVDGKDVKCHRYKAADKMCNGKDNPEKGGKIWYSEEVPGHLVKLESAAVKWTLLRFEAKK